MKVVDVEGDARGEELVVADEEEEAVGVDEATVEEDVEGVTPGEFEGLEEATGEDEGDVEAGITEDELVEDGVGVGGSELDDDGLGDGLGEGVTPATAQVVDPVESTRVMVVIGGPYRSFPLNKASVYGTLLNV